MNSAVIAQATVLTDVSNRTAMTSVALPPSTILKQEFNKARKPVDEAFVERAVKKTLLSTCDTKMWLDHLQVVCDNRKRVARKAALTQARNLDVNNSREDAECHCGVCGKLYTEETDTPELWIACNVWYCAVCEHLSVIPQEVYICCKCRL